MRETNTLTVDAARWAGIRQIRLFRPLLLSLGMFVALGCNPATTELEPQVPSESQPDPQAAKADAAPQSPAETGRTGSANPTESDEATDQALAKKLVRKAGSIRFATYNVAMNRKRAGGMIQALGDGGLLAGKRVAEIVQRVRPQVLLLNEVDYDSDSTAINTLLEKYLGVAQGEQQPIEYPYMYTDVVNTGEPSGLDLDKDGKSDGPGDGFGYGSFPGQYGMVVLSQYPIKQDAVRTLRKFLWKDMPDWTMPIDPESKKPYYSDEVSAKFRLSSKSHWDIPIEIEGKLVHFLVCHPTPPVFDGPEDRNGCRNHDEIRLWADYVDPDKSGYLYDDAGKKGGLSAGDHFVIAGDLNSDPMDGDSKTGAAQQLVEHRLVNASVIPASTGGGAAKAKKDGRSNEKHAGDPNHDTGDFGDKYSGNLRIDYVLPSRTLSLTGSGVFWPSPGAKSAALVVASDHRLVWIDVAVP